MGLYTQCSQNKIKADNISKWLVKNLSILTVAVCAMFGNNLVKVRANAKCNKIKVSATKIEFTEKC